MFDIVRRYADDVEEYSIDGASAEVPFVSPGVEDLVPIWRSDIPTTVPTVMATRSTNTVMTLDGDFFKGTDSTTDPRGWIGIWGTCSI
jgi:hypothetical protein